MAIPLKKKTHSGACDHSLLSVPQEAIRRELENRPGHLSEVAVPVLSPAAAVASKAHRGLARGLSLAWPHGEAVLATQYRRGAQTS